MKSDTIAESNIPLQLPPKCIKHGLFLSEWRDDEGESEFEARITGSAGGWCKHPPGEFSEEAGGHARSSLLITMLTM